MPASPASTETSSPLSKRTSVRLSASCRSAASKPPTPSVETARGPEALENFPEPAKTYAKAWRVVATDYYVDVALTQTARNESFTSGYLQVERQLPSRFTVFGRLEDSARMQQSRYVGLFNDGYGDIEIALRRQALGVRWDFTRRQALTLEISHIVSLSQVSNQIRAQWSAAIP